MRSEPNPTTESSDPDLVLNTRGPPDVVAEYLSGLVYVGVDEVTGILRSPRDPETIERVAGVRALI